MSIKIALAGNPNCGKTTLFNNLTRSNQYVGNWPGVTVEKKEGRPVSTRCLRTRWKKWFPVLIWSRRSPMPS